MSITGTYTVKVLGRDGKEEIELIFGDENPIHFDDNIDTIKTKIIIKLLLLEVGDKYNKKDMYLFCKRKTELFSSAVIDTLTRRGSRSKITDTDFRDFFMNIVSYCDEDGENCLPFNQPVITDNSSKLDLEVLQMRLDGKKYIVDEVLGKRNTILEYPVVVCNPFKSSGEETTNLKNDPLSLLLDSGPIYENTIYLSFLGETQEGDIIKSGDDFQKYRTKFDKIKELYSLYKNKPKINDLTDLSGITKISLSIKPEANYLSVSTENLFKIIHATKKNPLVAYRPYKKASLVYRLYSAQKTKEDVNVPVIQIAAINVIETFINRDKDDDSVFVLIKYGEEKKKEIYCQISSSFEITITCNFEDNSINSESDVDALIQENVNPLLQSISRFFERVGYKLNLFTSLADYDRVKINEMSYTYIYGGNYDFTRTICFDSIFFQEREGIYRYKRVSGGEDDGFATVFKEEGKVIGGTNRTEKSLTISSINDINYLSVLPIYLKSLAVQHLLTAQELESITQVCTMRGGEGSSSSDSSSQELATERNTASVKPPSTVQANFLSDSSDSDVKPPSTVQANFLSDSSDSDVKPPSTVQANFLSDSSDSDVKPPSTVHANFLSDSNSIDSSDPKSPAVEANWVRRSSDSNSSDPKPPAVVAKTTNDNEAKRIRNSSDYSSSDDPFLDGSDPEEDDDEKKTPVVEPQAKTEEIGIIRQRITKNAKDKQKKNDDELVADGKAVLKYLKDTGNKFKPDYTKFCQKGKKTIVLSRAALQELQAKDESFKEKGRVLTDGDYNFVCKPTDDEFKDFKYPKFDTRGLPCCYKLYKDAAPPRPPPAAAHVKKFSPDTQLAQGHWGFLPTALNKELNKNECGADIINKDKKANTSCFLINGVEETRTQTFISCISSATAILADRGPRSNKEMKRDIINSITLDNFMKYQNGNLVTDFQDTADLLEKCEDVMEIKNLDDDLRSSEVFKKLDIMNNETDKDFFLKVLSAYINFINYLRDDEIEIDYTYLWDIVCFPNKNIFVHGVNLIIINANKEEELSVVCPSNHYSNSMYNEKLDTLFLIRKDAKDSTYYEPMYYRGMTTDKKSKQSVIQKLFRFDEKDTAINNLIRISRPLFEKCKPLRLEEEVYKTPIILADLADLLTREKLKFKQMVSYDNKVFGLSVESHGFIPCYPGSILPEFEYDFVRNNNIFANYQTTKANLLFFSTTYNIPCAPINKITDEENSIVYIVGILTEANQFVQLLKPEKMIEDDIVSLGDYNYVLTPDGTVPLLMSNKLDRDRMDEMKRYKLENDFYNAFRSTVKIALNDFENEDLLKIRESIEEEIDSMYAIYTNQIREITRLLEILIGDKVIFTEDINYYSLVDEVSTCINRKEDDDCARTQTCENNNGKCSLIVPEINLISKNKSRKNKDLYYKKMADELLRYEHIRRQMFSPRKFIVFSNMDYNLRSDEVILIGNKIELENYYRGLVPLPANKYSTFNSYDEVNPRHSGIYKRGDDEEDVSKRGGGRKTRKPKKKVKKNKTRKR
jgi:hypothetical protein